MILILEVTQTWVAMLRVSREEQNDIRDLFSEQKAKIKKKKKNKEKNDYVF